MSWSVQAKRNIIGVIWMAGGLLLLVAAMKQPIYLTALVVFAGVLLVCTRRLTCPRCGARVRPPAGDSLLLRKLPSECPKCGLKTTENA
jgi:hypothetical protein